SFHHFNNEIFILHNRAKGSTENSTGLAEIKRLMLKHGVSAHSFSTSGSEGENMNDKEHVEVIMRCKEHIARGDVFQIVPSRCFTQAFQGDDFQVYRILRSINPSPYLFYFDYGDYRLFGSSPEAQIVVSNGKASIYPIAGTYRRSV